MTVDLLTIVCSGCGHPHVATFDAARRPRCPFCGDHLPARTVAAHTEQPSDRERQEHAGARSVLFDAPEAA